jgi:hypothetical protein
MASEASQVCHGPVLKSANSDATDVMIKIVIALHLKQWCPGEQQLDPHTHTQTHTHVHVSSLMEFI